MKSSWLFCRMNKTELVMPNCGIWVWIFSRFAVWTAGILMSNSRQIFSSMMENLLLGANIDGTVVTWGKRQCESWTLVSPKSLVETISQEFCSIPCQNLMMHFCLFVIVKFWYVTRVIIFYSIISSQFFSQLHFLTRNCQNTKIFIASLLWFFW